MKSISLSMGSLAFATLLVLTVNAHAQSITTLGIPADDSALTEQDPDGLHFRGLSIKSQARQMADALLLNAQSGGISGAPSAALLGGVKGSCGVDAMGTAANSPRS
jgi:hypothetical protein